MGDADLLVEPRLIGGDLKPIGVIADPHGGPHHVCDLADPGGQGRGVARLQQIDGQGQAMHRVDPDPHRQPRPGACDTRQVRPQRGDELVANRDPDHGLAS
jgi:hypothetical protein